MSELSKVWGEVTLLLEQGISVIAVRDKDGKNHRGDLVIAKSPIGKWKEFQERIVTKDELWKTMEHHDTCAIGIVCGKISGNIEVVDIDVKYKPGIDAILFKDLQSFFPDLYEKLRINKTPSGGYHIIYRVSGNPVPGNLKLAGRIATEEELQAQISRGVKRPNKEINFLETRAEGGYILAPPSLGYATHRDKTIPVITWEERCSIINLCESYTEIIQEAPKPKPTKQESSIYTENPFEHFNNDCDPVQLMQKFGYSFSHQNSKFIWFTRPDKKTGVSISWNLQKRIFYVFTTSTELKPNTGYHPASILSELEFGGDKSKTFFWLINNGYGKHTKQYEQRVIKQRTSTPGIIPKNLSNEAKEVLQAAQIAYQEDHPYGVFWELDEDDKLRIDREGLYRVSYGLGFRIHEQDIVRIVGCFIHNINDREYFDIIKDYIKEEDASYYNDICNTYESFIQKSGSFTISRLRLLDTENIVTDSEHRAYKFFKNDIVLITEYGTEIIPYSSLDNELIWHKKVIQRDWQPFAPDKCKYTEFLSLACGLSDQIKKVIGYLVHDYKGENTGYIITLTEICPDPKGGGGSGKNIFGNLLRLATNVHTVSGTQVQLNEKFLQSWKRQRVMFLADVPKKFDFEFLKEISTGYGTLKRLFKDEEALSPEEMPKLLINTNFSFDASDGGLKRRIIPIEFTDFFTKCGGVDVHFGCMFPSGWTEQDYVGFDHFIIECLQSYFKCKGKIIATELSDTGWEKQFIQKFGETTYNFINEHINSWLQDVHINSENFNRQYNLYMTENNVKKNFEFSSILMNRSLSEYCSRHFIDFDKQVSYRDHEGTLFKGRRFAKK